MSHVEYGSYTPPPKPNKEGVLETIASIGVPLARNATYAVRNAIGGTWLIGEKALIPFAVPTALRIDKQGRKRVSDTIIRRQGNREFETALVTEYLPRAPVEKWEQESGPLDKEGLDLIGPLQRPLTMKENFMSGKWSFGRIIGRVVGTAGGVVPFALHAKMLYEVYQNTGPLLGTVALATLYASTNALSALGEAGRTHAYERRSEQWAGINQNA